MDVLKYGRSLSPAQIIVYSFALFILAGTALLMLPAATVDGAGATFTDALFTIVSAVCVTGLSVQDTGTYWTFFGQAVILFAIQVGGLGVVTAAISLTVFSGRRSASCSAIPCRKHWRRHSSRASSSWCSSS